MMGDHARLVEAGWAYRQSPGGWLLYRDPITGRWHDRDEALAIEDERDGDES
jgi:hypothetical protein